MQVLIHRVCLCRCLCSVFFSTVCHHTRSPVPISFLFLRMLHNPCHCRHRKRGKKTYLDFGLWTPSVDVEIQSLYHVVDVMNVRSLLTVSLHRTSCRIIGWLVPFAAATPLFERCMATSAVAEFGMYSRNSVTWHKVECLRSFSTTWSKFRWRC
jgi:hypothetical protein